MSESAKNIFAGNLRRLLQQKNLTQLELAEYMGVASSTVSDWCSGKKYPRVQKIERMAAFLGVGMEELTTDVLDNVDVAFYGEYKALDERDKETLRDMVRVMRARRARREGESEE